SRRGARQARAVDASAAPSSRSPWPRTVGWSRAGTTTTEPAFSSGSACSQNASGVPEPFSSQSARGDPLGEPPPTPSRRQEPRSESGIRLEEAELNRALSNSFATDKPVTECGKDDAGFQSAGLRAAADASVG